MPGVIDSALASTPTVDPVRLSFVSDIHGNIDGLADVARRVDQLVVLGDLLDYVDYYDPAGDVGEAGDVAVDVGDEREPHDGPG